MKRSQTLAAAASAAFLSTVGLAEAAEAPVQGPVAYSDAELLARAVRDKGINEQFRLQAPPPFTIGPYIMPEEKGVIVKWRPPDESDLTIVIGKHKRMKPADERLYPQIRGNLPSGSNTSYGASLNLKFW